MNRKVKTMTTLFLRPDFRDPIARRAALIGRLARPFVAFGHLLLRARPGPTLADLSPRTLQDIGLCDARRAEAELMGAYARWLAEVKDLRGL